MDRKFEQPRPVPVLYANKDAVPGGEGQAVTVPVTAEGIYCGNGEYQDPQETTFRIVEAEKLENGDTRWGGRAFIERARRRGNGIF